MYQSSYNNIYLGSQNLHSINILTLVSTCYITNAFSISESALALNLSLNCPAKLLAAKVRICLLEEPRKEKKKKSLISLILQIVRQTSPSLYSCNKYKWRVVTNCHKQSLVFGKITLLCNISHPFIILFLNP